MGKRVRVPAALHTFDFVTGESGSTVLSHSSPVKMPTFRIKWKPSSATERDINDLEQENDDANTSSLFMRIESLSRIDCLSDEEEQVSTTNPTSTECVMEECVPIVPLEETKEHDELAAPAKLISSDNNKSQESVNDDKINSLTLIVGSKIKAKSFRHRFLKRVNSQIDNVTSIVNSKGGSALRGIALFRSKARLIIMLKRFLGVSMKQFVAPEEFDIFEVQVKVKHSPKPVTESPMMEKQDDSHLRKELLERAKAHYEQKLCRKVLKKMAQWRRYQLDLKEKRAQQMHEEKERLLVMNDKAATLYQKSLLRKFFHSLKDHTINQKNERAKALPVPEAEPDTAIPAEEHDVETRSAMLERKLFAAEDHRSTCFRGHCHEFFGIDSYLLDELDYMELATGRRRPCGLHIFSEDEYKEQFEKGIELKRAPFPVPVQEPIMLLDQETLQKMKQDKFAGKSNLFDVPDEFAFPSFTNDKIDPVEYRTKETVRGLVNQAS